MPSGPGHRARSVRRQSPAGRDPYSAKRMGGGRISCKVSSRSVRVKVLTMHPGGDHSAERAQAAGEPPAQVDPRAWVADHGDYLYRYARRGPAPGGGRGPRPGNATRRVAGQGGVRRRPSERTWLTAILKRKAVDWLRRRVRERLRSAGDEPDGFAAGLFTRRGVWKADRPVAGTGAAPRRARPDQEFSGHCCGYLWEAPAPGCTTRSPSAIWTRRRARRCVGNSNWRVEPVRDVATGPAAPCGTACPETGSAGARWGGVEA